MFSFFKKRFTPQLQQEVARYIHEHYQPAPPPPPPPPLPSLMTWMASSTSASTQTEVPPQEYTIRRSKVKLEDSLVQNKLLKYPKFAPEKKPEVEAERTSCSVSSHQEREARKEGQKEAPQASPADEIKLRREAYFSPNQKKPSEDLPLKQSVLKGGLPSTGTTVMFRRETGRRHELGVPCFKHPNITFEESLKLRDILVGISSDFAEELVRLIASSGMSRVTCYRKAQISRQHFSKIIKSSDYSPKKPTVFAFALALRLSVEETEKLLKTAGYTFSQSSYMDLILKFALTEGIYNIDIVNQMLDFYGEKPLT